MEHRRCCCVRWLLLLLLATVIQSVTSGQLSRSPTLPLIPDSREPDKRHSGPGCWLGEHFYNLQERWSPALLPQGVMHCVKCQCLAVEKKGVLQTEGLVRCKNIKDDCPTPQCDHPVLHPDRCCKTCPGDENDFEANFSFQSLTNLAPTYSGDHSHPDTAPSEFVAVLVGSGVRGQPVRTDTVAVVYLSVQGGELRFAVKHSRLHRAKLLQIVDANGNVLFKQRIHKRGRPDRKVCGLWSKIPDVYTRYLRQERLFAVITTSRHQRGHVAGKIVVNTMAGRDTFQAVLSPNSDSGIGGAASLTFDSRRQTLHYVITLNGVLDDSPTRSEYFVTIEKRSKIVHKSRGRLDQQVTTVTGSWQLNRKRQAKQLGRGRLRLRVTSIRGTTVSGKIEPRLTCGVFQAVLSPARRKKRGRQPAAGSGSVVLQLLEKGRLHYKVRLSGMETAVTGITLETSTGRKRRRHVVSSLIQSFRPDAGSLDGWANGTVKRLRADDIAALLGDELSLHVRTRQRRKSALRGRLTELPYRKFMDAGLVLPFKLSPLMTLGQSLNAHAWLWLEAGCALRYDVIVAGVHRRRRQFQMLLGSRGNDLQPSSVRDTVSQVSSGRHGVSVVSGTYSDLSQDLFRDLDFGRAYLQVNAGDDASSVVVGNVTVRNTCWQYVRDSEDTDTFVDVTEDGGTGGEREEGEEDTESSWPRLKCYYESRFYDNGESWLPTVNASCNTCSCINGKPQCHAVVCPPLSCPAPVVPPGECCPVCPGTEEGPACRLTGDPRSYPLGRSWHPFLPLKGFSVCVNCTCMAGGVPRCERLPCPPLTCPEHLRLRRHPDDCCQVCAEEGEQENNDFDADTKPLRDVDMQGACTFVDRTYPNGSSWHPHVPPFGVMKCIVCSCRDGAYRCGKRRCPAKCRRKRRRRNPCCEPCTPDRKGGTDEKEAKPEPQGCEFGGKTYKEKEKWRPPASPFGSGRCAVCKCKKGRAKCKLRCPSRCSRPGAASHICCRQCAARAASSGRKRPTASTTEKTTQVTKAT